MCQLNVSLYHQNKSILRSLICKTSFLYSQPNVWYVVAAAAAKSPQSCPTLCDPRDGSPPVPVILQARTLEWVAISLSNA